MRQPTTDQHQSSTSTSPLSIIVKPSPPSFNYVDLDSISDELICPICSLPFVDPVVHNPPSSECGNTFCRSCIQSCPSCPFCRRGDETNVFQLECSSAPKIISKQLEKLKVICSMCKNVVCRGEYKDHQEKHCPLLEAYARVEALKVELAKLNADRLEQEKVKLENDYNKLKQDLEKERQRLNAEIDRMKQDLQKKDQELQQEFSSRFRTEMSQKPLHLNVGGKFMSVSISDFMNREREPESLFLKMLSGEHPFYESKIFSLENHPVGSVLVASSSPASIAIHQEQMDGEFKNHHHSTGTTKASSTSTTTSWNNTTMMSTQPRSTIFGGFNLGLNTTSPSTHRTCSTSKTTSWNSATMNQSSKSSSNSSTGGKSGGVGSFSFGGSFVPPSSPTTSTTTTTTTFPRLTLGGEFNMVPASSSKETISGTTVSNTWFGSSESKNTNGFTTTRSSFEMTTPTTTSRSNTTGGEEPSSSNSTSFGFTPVKPHHSVRNLSEDKVYFVNCDPVVFEHIVRWLRYGIVSSEFNESLLVELKTACREYHLTNLGKEIERMESKKREKLTQIQFLKILNTNSSKLSNKMISLNLSGLDMTRLRICNVNMSSSDIFDSDMSKCILTNVNLSGSNLSETHFNEASFEKVNFSKCNLTNCNFDIVTKMEERTYLLAPYTLHFSAVCNGT